VRNIDLVSTTGNSQILFGFDWKRVDSLIPDKSVVIITDDNILNLYKKDFPDFPVLSVTPGEVSKRLSVIDQLVDDMLKLGIDRDGFILAVGGGVVCDIAGFLASVYMRGIRFGFVSTSLLSQVDASTGGKNGVNSSSSKNIIGVFRQPEFVICDESMLDTLSDEEYLSGLSELIKMAFILDSGLMQKIAENIEKLVLRDKDILRDLISRAVRLKANIVEADPQESGIRRILNFGHTFGHAAESVYGIRHGIAVAWGMKAAFDLSTHSGYLKEEDNLTMSNLLASLGLLKDVGISGKRIAAGIANDKKRSGTDINFVFIDRPGSAFVGKVPVSTLADYIRSYS
jgi:3-dehydroquinate synthase